MKKIIVFFLIWISIAALAGCTENSRTQQSSIIFYFRTAETTFAVENGIISSENREFHTNNVQSILTEYLNGPKNEQLISPFPENLKLEELITGPTRTTIVLSEEIGELANQDLTIACACLSKTVFELTGTKSVEVKSGDGLIGGMQSIVLIENDLSLFDDYFSSSKGS